MKRQIMVMAVSAMILGGALASQAMPGPGGMPGPGCGEHQAPAPFPPFVVRALELTDAQKQQIQTIMKDAQVQDQAQKEKLAPLHKQLRDAERSTTFNEAAVKNTAAAIANLEAELMVAHLKTRSRINAVLTPAQRSLADKLRPEPEDLPQHPHGPGEPRPDRHPGHPERGDWR